MSFVGQIGRFVVTNEKCISVIVPVFNIEEYVAKCIESIIEQTYKNLEIILVDDGSTDKSGHICDEYALKDRRITVIHKANGGLSDARNRGLEIATGDIISFVDGDDMIHPQMYEMLIYAMEQELSDLAVCGFSYDKKDLETKYNISEIDFSFMTGTEALLNPDKTQQSSCNKIYKRQIFDDVRYPSGKLHEDEFVLHEIMYKAKKVVVINSPLYYYAVRNGSIMSTVTYRRIKDALEAFENRISFAKHNEWYEVMQIAVMQYCEYCIKMYKVVLEDECSKFNGSVSVELVQNERRIIRENKDIDIGKRYRLFAMSPRLYLCWERIKGFYRHNEE